MSVIPAQFSASVILSAAKDLNRSIATLQNRSWISESRTAA